MSATLAACHRAFPFLRQACLSPVKLPRFSSNICIKYTPPGRPVSPILAASDFRLRVNQQSTVASVVAQSRTSSLPQNAPRLPSILQFVSNRVWRATHRDRNTSFAARYGYSPKPPKRRGPFEWFRDQVNSIPSQVIFWGIMVLNGLVYATWQYSYVLIGSTGDAHLRQWLQENFTVSMQNFSEGRIWTLLTCCFSHELTGHLFVNAFTYYFMAPPVLAVLGNLGFLGLYLGGGIISSFTSLWWNNAVRHHPNQSSHGASGAIYSVVTFYACAAPRSTFYLFAIVPIPAWLCVTGLFLFDGYSALYDRRTQTDSAGHVGGALGGLAFWLAKILRIF